MNSRALDRDLLRRLARMTVWLGEDAQALPDALERTAGTWAEATAEMLLRWNGDRAEIAGAFPALGRSRVVRVATGLGDPHDGGRTVARIVLESGRHVYYKPRDCEADAAVLALLARLDRMQGQGSGAYPRVLVRDGYAWMEAVDAKAPVTASQRRAASRNAGVLLARLDFLQGVDFHDENVLCRRDAVVPIDLETVLQPGLHWRSEPAWEPEDPATVLRVGILPGHASDGAGRWLAADGVAEGFARGYRQLLRAADHLVEYAEVVALRRVRIRALRRATSEYTGMTRDAFRAGRIPEGVGPEEASAMRRLDVPRFAMPAHRGWTRAQRWLTAAGEKDLTERLAVIRATLELASLRRATARHAADAAG